MLQNVVHKTVFGIQFYTLLVHLPYHYLYNFKLKNKVIFLNVQILNTAQVIVIIKRKVISIKLIIV